MLEISLMNYLKFLNLAVVTARPFCAINDPLHIHKEQRFFKGMIFHESSINFNQFSSKETIVENFIYNCSPICTLFWLTCSLTRSNQVKVFHLIDVALSTSLINVKNDSSKVLTSTELTVTSLIILDY